MNQLTGPRGDVASHFVGRLVFMEPHPNKNRIAREERLQPSLQKGRFSTVGYERQPRRIASIALSAVARSNWVRFSAIMP